MSRGHTTDAVHDDAPASARYEVELLLCCARTNISPSAASRIRALLQESIDWDQLRLMALAQGVGPLLYRSLRHTHPEGVPSRVLEELHSYVRWNAWRSFLLTGRLVGLLAAFRDRGIRAIPFKGPLLAVHVYRDLTLRHFADIDVLVHKRDVAQAKALLTAHGYRQRMSHPWEAPFEDDSGICVDLHWGIAPSYDPTPQTFDQLWMRVVPVSLAGMEVPTLAPEDLLLILSIQLVKDWRESGQRLVQICDTAELLRSHPDLDWKYVSRLARAAGGERILQLDLLLAHDLLDAPLPEAVLRSAQGSRAVRALVHELRARILPAAAELSLPHSGLPNDETAFYLRTRERLRDKLRYFMLRGQERIRLAVHPSRSDRESLPLPAWLDFLYYLVRPVRALSRWVRERSVAARPLSDMLGERPGAKKAASPARGTRRDEHHFPAEP